MLQRILQNELADQLKKCEPYRVNSLILEFEELPEVEQIILQHYNKTTDFILHCKECEIYKLLPEKSNTCEKLYKPDS